MAKNKKKKGIIQEFKEFAIQGNLFDMAIGVIIGGVFKDLVTSFTNNIIMPFISIFTGDVDFSQLKIALGPEKITYDETGAVVEDLTNYLRYGDFLSSVISFLILMIVVFVMVKTVNKLRALGKKKEEEVPAAPPEPSNEEKLLTEIRDLLKEK